MNLVQTFQCDNDSVCSHCDIMDTTNLHPRILPGAWISYECNHTLLATTVKVATAADTKSSSNLFVCGIDVFGSKITLVYISVTISLDRFLQIKTFTNQNNWFIQNIVARVECPP